MKSTRDENTAYRKYWTNDEEGRYEDEGERSDGEHQGYQLLTEVKNGAPMSSLFSVLSLFTEDVKLRHDEDQELRPASSGSSGGFFPLQIPLLMMIDHIDQILKGNTLAANHKRENPCIPIL